MGIVSLEMDARETVHAIVEKSRVTVRQLQSGKSACEGKAPPHLLTGLHLWLVDLSAFWLSLGLVAPNAEGTLTLTPKGLDVQALLAEREANPDYDLLARFDDVYAAGSALRAEIEAAIGPAPAQFVLNPQSGKYEINHMVLPDLAASIQSVIDML